ncbi:MAG: glycosyltransferase [Methyloprofundus sp.]|nr:glycosyltransferase [Methyloprofundus sp.]
MSYPLVSICIPTFNGEKFIDEAMQSAIAQTYRPLEIIVSDDASSDETLSIIKSFISKTEIPIKIFHHKPTGIGANWNNCVKKSNGDYIKFLFQDDLLTPDCIKAMIELAIKDKEIGLIFSKRGFIFEGNDNDQKKWINQFKDLHSSWKKIENIQHGRKLLKDKNFLSTPRNKIGEPTVVLLKKSVFEKAGYFSTELTQSLDYEFWYRVFKYFKVGFIDRELATFRLHDQQATAKNKKSNFPDYNDYPEIVYHNLFWYLHPKLKKDLFFKYNYFGKLIKIFL